MGHDERIEELLLRWEEARRAGTRPSPEELCADAPELLEKVRQAITAILSMEDVLLGDRDRPTLITPSDSSSPDAEASPHPKVPGYVILDLIDQGGMGVVYKARHVELGRIVALKMMSDLRLAPKMIARFRTEAEAAARLQHPNVIQVFEVGQVNSRPFLSMEYVDGGSLAERLRQQRMPVREAAALAETLARAVHATHQCGIVHRDLKPANIMLTRDGQPKLADFGLAKRLDEEAGHTHTGEVLGTPSYMSPEQAQGHKELIGPATDVYALGVILYEMLAGQPPFRGATALDSLRLVTTQEPTPPSWLASGVPRDLEAICLKCLEKRPAHRYGSAELLGDDLRRFLQGQTVSVRPLGPVRRSLRWCRRHPTWIAVAVAAVVLALVPILVAQARHRAHQAIRQKAIDLTPQVREILQRNCYACHGKNAKKIERDLNILDHTLLLDQKRRIVVPEAPANSRLIQRIEDGSMPPEEEEENFPRVTEAEVVILKDWILGGAPPLPPEDPKRPVPPVVPFSPLAAKVKSIFQEHCYECHKFDVAKGGIKILHHRLLVTVRKVVIPGHPEASELFHLISSKDDKLRMPPMDYPRLDDKQIEAVRRWIQAGAPGFTRE